MEKRKKTVHRVLVSGYYGFGNTGDEAILMAIVESLKSQSDDILVTALSADPVATRKEHGIDAISRTNPLAVFWEILKADLVISGGGGLIQDVTSSRSIPYYLMIVYLAKRMNKKVMLYANGVGPVYRDINKRMIKKVCNMVDLITVRDEASREELVSLGVGLPEIIVTADPAFVLEPLDKIPQEELAEDKDASDRLDGPTIGVSIRPWDLETSREIIAAACDFLIKDWNANVLFLPMQYPADYEESKKIISLMKENAEIIREAMGPKELMNLCGNMDLIFGMRLHALIFGAKMGVPLVGLIYDPKVENFLKIVDQPSAGRPKDLKLVDLCNLLGDALKLRKTRRKKLLKKKDDLTVSAMENARLAIELLRGARP